MTWLITGGAGYIGGHVVAELLRDGLDMVVVDDLSTGDAARLPRDVPLYQGSVLDTQLLCRVLRTHPSEGVIHLAGRKAVADSIARPLDYYRQNVLGMHSVLDAVLGAGVPNVVFSSSAAVYGVPDRGIVTEHSPTRPLSPYGRTKLVCEHMLRDTAAAHGLNWVALRYFNVGGAANSQLGDSHGHNLIPQVLAAIAAHTQPQVFGLDHPTPDGTCIRDYVHVHDLARAHAAVIKLLRNHRTSEIYNVGTGCGASVHQVIHAAQKATGATVTYLPAPARPGDPPVMIADPTKIATQLGWRARFDLEHIVTSAWQAFTAASHVA